MFIQVAQQDTDVSLGNLEVDCLPRFPHEPRVRNHDGCRQGARRVAQRGSRRRVVTVRRLMRQGGFRWSHRRSPCSTWAWVRVSLVGRRRAPGA
jgi:hypothetical protein